MELLISLKGKLENSLPESVRKAAAEAADLQKKLSKLYARADVTHVESFAGFVCTK